MTEGLCVQLLPSGVTYSNVLSPDIRRIISESLEKGKVIDELLVKDPDPQVRIVLRRCGQVDPESLEDLLARGRLRRPGEGSVRNVAGRRDRGNEDEPACAVAVVPDSRPGASGS